MILQFNGPVVHLVECLLCMQEVSGSSPLGSTIIMSEFLQFKDLKIEVKTSAQARRWRLAVHADGRIVLTRPKSFFQLPPDKIIAERYDWLKAKTKFWQEHRGNAPILSKTQQRQAYLQNKIAARNLVRARLEFYNQKYKLKYNRISIKNTATTWGSCSSRGNLNFNYKIVLLPERLADYIVVHELCHLAALNHSTRFWRLVGESLPDYKLLRAQLKKIGRLS